MDQWFHDTVDPIVIWNIDFKISCAAVTAHVIIANQFTSSTFPQHGSKKDDCLQGTGCDLVQLQLPDDRFDIVPDQACIAGIHGDRPLRFPI